ncbi:MAG: methyltransferase domain-containing protein [Planctomycetes bacterium]|nr:methyltransferase domain-containing protein [Planctomycetota bacterium]
MRCIICGSENVNELFLLKDGPRYAQKLLDSPDPKQGPRVDVHLFKCADCHMVQIDPDSLEHDEYWEDYLMSRACTELYVKYDNEIASLMTGRYSLVGKDVVEIGCGDGFFADLMNKRGCRMTAIEPSATACRIASEAGVKCINAFLDDDITKHCDQKFDGFVSKQVMDLVKDPPSFIRNLGKLLNPGAIGLIDVPSWTKTIREHRYFDVLPDRVGYYTAETLTDLMERSGFHVLESFHGAEDEYVGIIAVWEGEVNGIEKTFCRDFERFNQEFTSLMKQMNDAGKSVAAWGAGAKGVTIFSFTGMNKDTIKYVIDKDPHKAGKYLPGSLLPVMQPDMLQKEPVDALIITAAMFYKEIVRDLVKNKNYTGDVILLSPTVRVLSQDEIKAIIADE